MVPMQIFEKYTFSPNEDGPAIVSSAVPFDATGVLGKLPDITYDFQDSQSSLTLMNLNGDELIVRGFFQKTSWTGTPPNPYKH